MESSQSNILVTGATGNTGAEVLLALKRRNQPVVAAIRKPEDAAKLESGQAYTIFDINEPDTFPAALQGIEKVYLMRPPANADSHVFETFVQAAQQAGIKHIVYLSVLGAERNPVIPHHGIEKIILNSGIPYTFLRPSYFMQNLSTTHRDDIRLHDQIFVPAGKGKTSFIDIRDIAEVAVLAFTQPGHLTKAYELTGSEALDYYQVANLFTQALGRKVEYTRPTIFKFYREMNKRGVQGGFTLVMIALYTVASLGMAAKITTEVETLLGRKPITFRQFIEDNKTCWIK
jgi:uncharacterized protein YbjT (DUF2867 family)